MKPVPPSAPSHVRKPSAWRLRILRGCAKAHVVVSLLALSFSTTYAASPAPFSGADLLGILALGGVAYGGVLLAGISRVAPWRVNAVFAVLAVAGVASAHAIHTPLFLTNPVLLWALLGMAGCAVFVVFGAIDRSPSVGLALVALGSVAVGLYAAEQLWGRIARPGVVVFGDTSNLRDVAFARRPNIYFLSFDGMAPRVLLREHMGVENTPFHDLFNARFRRFENFFVNAIYTRVALESLLALDERLYDTMVRELRKKTGNGYGQPMFSGHSPSPLFGLLKKNGYETNTAFAGEFFGKRKGPFVDRYFTGGNPLVCNLLDDRVRAFSFWGHCLVVAWRGNAANARARERVIDYLGEASLRDARSSRWRTSTPRDTSAVPSSAMATKPNSPHSARTTGAAAPRRQGCWRGSSPIWTKTTRRRSCWCTATTGRSCPPTRRSPTLPISSCRITTASWAACIRRQLVSSGSTKPWRDAATSPCSTPRMW